MNNTTKHFIKFLKGHNMLIPVMVEMARNEVTFENLHKKTKERSSYGMPRPYYYMDVVESKMFSDMETEDGQYIDIIWMDYLDKHDEEDTAILPDPTPSKPNRPKERQDFIDILKENDALIPFCVNVASGIKYRGGLKDNLQHLNMTLTEALSIRPEHDFANTPTMHFCWSSASEVNVFWSSVYDKTFFIKCNSQ